MLNFVVVLIISSFAVASLVSAGTERKLDERVQLGTYYGTFVDYETTSDSYMLVGNQVYFPAGEYMSAGDGETAVNTATSYVDLSKSCILGDYASEPMLWSQFSFIQSTYSGSETETGDTAATTVTDPSLSAGSTSTYVSAAIDLTGANTDGGSAQETVSWVANAWYDLDDDGTDDSATVPEEDFVKCTKDVYIYFSAMVDCSDTDTTAWLEIQVGFYVDASTIYYVIIRLNGGDGGATAYTSDWDYTGTNNATKIYAEVEDDHVAGIISVAEVISDDSNNDPAIMGVDEVVMLLGADDNYGAGTPDSITGYIYNLAIFDDLPAITDNTPSTDLDDTLTGGADNAVEGDATYFSSHNVLCGYYAAAATNDAIGLVYLDTDVISGQELINTWHQIYFYGTAELVPDTYVTSVGYDSGGIKRTVTATFDFNKRKLSAPQEAISATWTTAYSNAYIYLTTDDDVFRGDGKEFHLDIVPGSASVGGIDETDDIVQALVNQDSDSDVAVYTWGSAPTTGIIEFRYSYYCVDDAGGLSIEGIIGFVSGNILLLGGLVLGFFLLRRRK